MRTLLGMGAYLCLVFGAFGWVEWRTRKRRIKRDRVIDEKWDAFAHGDWRWK